MPAIFQVRDATGHLWGEADTTGPLEPLCFQGRILYQWSTYAGEYRELEEQPHWMRRAAPVTGNTFVQPSRNYRDDYIVTVRRGDVVGKSNDRDTATVVARAGRRRALWKWTGTEYVSIPIERRVTHIIHGHHAYELPVTARDPWLVMSASGRVWARGNKVEDVMNDQVAGSRRALWQLTKQGYVLRAIGKEWIEEVQS